MRKILALLLALVMAVGLTAIPAGAEGGDGFGWLRWFWGYDDEHDTNYVIVNGMADQGPYDLVTDHAGRTAVVLLYKDGSPLTSTTGLTYVPTAGGVDVSFALTGEEDIEVRDEGVDGVLAIIDFNNWGAAGEIKYKGETLVSVLCAPDEFDYYANPDDEYPVNDWSFTGPGIPIYLVNNGDSTILRNRVHFFADGIDTESLGFSFGENAAGKEFIQLWFNDPISSEGDFCAQLSLKDPDGGDDGREVWIYVENDQAGLRWTEARWDDWGKPVYEDRLEGSLYWEVPAEYLNDRAKFIGVKSYDGTDYSDWIDPVMLSSSAPWVVDVSEAAGIVCLTPHSYGTCTIMGPGGALPVEIARAGLLTVQSVPGQAGEAVTVPVWVGQEDLVCNSLSLQVCYDPDVLTCTGGTLGVDPMTGEAYAGQLAVYSDQPGRAVIAWANDEDVRFTGGEVLMYLTFSAASDCPEDSYWLDLDEFHDRNDGPACGDASESDVPLVLEGADLRVYAGKAGDLDKSGVVDDKDAMALLRWIAGYPDDETGIDETMMDHRDVTNDGRINLFDVTRLLQYIANWAVEIYY